MAEWFPTSHVFPAPVCCADDVDRRGFIGCSEECALPSAYSTCAFTFNTIFGGHVSTGNPSVVRDG